MYHGKHVKYVQLFNSSTIIQMKQVQPHRSIDCSNDGPYACEKAMEQRATSKTVQVLVSKDWPREHDGRYVRDVF